MEEDLGLNAKCLGQDDWHVTFAKKLIDDNFLLTALEFHAELQEAGRELPKLKEFFSNPGNFEQQSFGRPDVILPRSSSQATLDSLDLTRYSEDGERAGDEKVAVLEFELRKAKETISALRANLTHVADVDNNSKNAGKVSAVRIEGTSTPQALIKPHEQRALNFLINEYLLHHGYRLTSITFADENENQDFDDWDDVGLNVPRPTELFYIYREGLKGFRGPEVQARSVECQTDCSKADADLQTDSISENEDELEELKILVSQLGKDKDDLILTLSELREESQKIIKSEESPSPEMFELIDGSSETKSVQSSDWTKVNEPIRNLDASMDVGKDNNCDVGLENFSSDTREVEGDQTLSTPPEIGGSWIPDVECENNDNVTVNADIIIPRNIPEPFQREILKRCGRNSFTGTDLLSELFKSTSLSDLTITELVGIQSTYLQKIIPNIILNKREEVIPILVLTICLCSDAAERDRLLALLYNLKKRPQDEERQQVLRALLTIAATLGPAVTENELLPQCWEQIGHKYMERRLMVAEACCALAPYVSEAIRNSLLLSMIQQLSEDREEAVRLCSVHCLALLVTQISVPDKYLQICQLAFNLLEDSCASVSQLVQSVLIPAVAQWSCELKRLQSDMLSQLLRCLCRAPSIACLSALEALLPYLIMFVASSETVMSHLEGPHPLATKRQEFASLCKGLYDPMIFFGPSVGGVVSAFDHLTANLEESTGWPELEWIMSDMLPKLLQLAEKHWDDKPVLQTIALLIRHLCAGLGKNVTFNLIKPELSRRLEICSSGLITGEVCNLEMIPLYLIGVLSLGPNDGAGLEQVGGTLLEFLCGLPLSGSPLLPLHIAIEILCTMDMHRVVVLDTLWEGVLHQRPLVRNGAATLLQSVIGRIPDALLASRVVPALVTLSSDPVIPVKLAVIPTLGMLGDAKERQTRDKINMTLQALLLEATSIGNNAIALQLASTLAEHWEKFDVSFRNEVILPHLATMADSCNGMQSIDLLKALTEVFSTIVLSTAQPPNHSLSTYIIPSLRHLESSCRQLNAPHGERLESLLRHSERLVPSTPTSYAAPEATALSPTARVEDVKNRVTKMFNTRPQSLQSVSGIFKKKP